MQIPSLWRRGWKTYNYEMGVQFWAKEVGNKTSRAIKLCIVLNINSRGVSSDEKWKNNKTVKQMNGNGKDKHVSIINKAKENKERILKK